MPFTFASEGMKFDVQFSNECTNYTLSFEGFVSEKHIDHVLQNWFTVSMTLLKMGVKNVMVGCGVLRKVYCATE